MKYIRHLAKQICIAVGMTSWIALRCGAAYAATSSLKADVDVSAPGCSQGCRIDLVISPFEGDPNADNLRQLMGKDLARTGMYMLQLNPGQSAQSAQVRGRIRPTSNGQLAIELTLTRSGQGVDPPLQLSLSSKPSQLRLAAHELADRVHKALSGQAALFKSRLTFVGRDTGNGRVNYTLVVADSDGENRHVLLRSVHPIVAPAWSPDGRQIAYVGYMPYPGHPTPKPRVWVVNPYTGNNRVLADHPGANTAPAWLPRGDELLLSLEMEGPAKLYRVSAGRTEAPKRLTTSSPLVLETEPATSPTGDIAFVTDRSGSFQINLIKSLASEVRPTPMSTSAQEAFSPAYSLDGRSLAFVGQSQGRTHLFLRNQNTNESRQLPDTTDAGRPAFSPNGRVIVFAIKKTNGSCELMSQAVNAPEPALTSLGNGCDPSWSPLLP